MVGDVESLRLEVDEIDRRLSALLVARFRRSREIIRLKTGSGLPVLDELRESDVLSIYSKGAPRDVAKAILLVSKRCRDDE